MSLRDRYAITDARLLKVLAQMERAIEEPLARGDLALSVGLSVRQLERLFVQRLGRTIDQLYLGIRLDQACLLLTRTGMPVTAIAMACGFRSSASSS